MAEAMFMYHRDDTSRLSKNFSINEFRCGCDNANGRCNFILSPLKFNLQFLRDIIQRPMHITSGFRCQSHNEAVGGTKNSYHTKGMAADFTCDNLEEVYNLLTSDPYLKSKFKGVGYYLNRNFIHVDVRNTEYQIIWVR